MHNLQFIQLAQYHEEEEKETGMTQRPVKVSGLKNNHAKTSANCCQKFNEMCLSNMLTFILTYFIYTSEHISLYIIAPCF